MFDQFVRLAQAKRAWRDAHYESALASLDDPMVRAHRKAVELRERVLRSLFDRAARRSQSGAHAAALADLELVLRVNREFPGAQALRDRLIDADRVRQQELTTAELQLRRARGLAERGELSAALAELDAQPANDADRSLRDWIETRRRLAAQTLERAREEIDAGALESGRQLIERATSMDNGLTAIEHWDRLADAEVADLSVRVRAHSHDSREVLRLFASANRRSGRRLMDHPKLSADVGRACEEFTGPLRAAIGRVDTAEALEILAPFDESERGILLDFIGMGGEDLTRLHEHCRTAAWHAAAAQVRSMASRDDANGRLWRGVLRVLDERAASTDLTLQHSRQLAVEGELMRARAVLVELLEVAPMHEAARQQLEWIDRGTRDREARLTGARAAAQAGRLQEALTTALSLAVPGAAGDESRLLLREVQARIDIVQQGLRQIENDAHGRASGSRTGLEHCVARLDELLRAQRDEPRVEQIAAALRAEIQGLDALAAAGRAATGADPSSLRESLQQFAALGGSFLHPGRLDARLLDVVDDIARVARGLVAGGRLSAAHDLLEAVASVVGDRHSVATALTELRAELERRVAAADAAVEAGFVALRARDVDAAEASLQLARDLHIDGASGRRLESAIAKIRDCDQQLRSVEAVIASGDPSAAVAGVASLGAVPGLFRTRIYDLKKNLARAQGLERAFLLRVDEGGEFLIVRSECVTIGNVRDGSADLPILANIAGRHARIRRTLSFHGGMQDELEAGQGEVFLDDQPVQRAPLRDGQVCRLGRSLQMTYRQPCRRSLSSALMLRGFTVAGTDKVLLMKDRGRDGRIVIGRGRDVHIQVPSADAEVEVFAGKDGQIRVRYSGRGTIDGRPFSGEEPLPAGALVRCGDGVAFVAVPWSHGDGA